MGSWEGWTPLPDHTGATTVCVVDDDMPLRRALRRLLRSVGFAVETFGTAEDYLAAEHAPSSAPPAHPQAVRRRLPHLGHRERPGRLPTLRAAAARRLGPRSDSLRAPAVARSRLTI